MYRILVLSALAIPSFAQPEPPPAPEPREMHFEPEEVQGGTENPGGESTAVRLFDPRGSLIRVRTDFQHELLQSAEDL